MTKQRELLVNKIQCPDGTILQSSHRHDYKEHTQEDGRIYFVDGGLAYQRIGHSDLEFTNLAIYSDDPHEVIRKGFTWTSIYDKNGKLLDNPEVRFLKDLDDKHVEVLCYYTLKGYPAKINQVFVDEFNYRKELEGKGD